MTSRLDEEKRDRRDHDRLHIDWSLNITSLIAVGALIVTILNVSSKAISYLRSIDAKTNIMWVHFDKSQLSKEELEKLQEVR